MCTERPWRLLKKAKQVAFLDWRAMRRRSRWGGGQRPRGEVIGRGAEFGVGRNGKNLQRIRITAEIDGVRCGYTITFGWRGARNEAVGRAYASVDTPGGRVADAERFSALMEALRSRGSTA